MRYEKGRKDASRSRIMEAAADRFRSDGIAATGLAGIMSEVGLTNGAFYPHFPSKAALIHECVSKALDEQLDQLQGAMAAGGVEAVVGAYLSAAHRDNPAKGCASAALLPELARAPADTRQLYTEYLQTLAGKLAAALPKQNKDDTQAAFGILATLIGTLQLARAVNDADLSDQLLEAGKNAVRTVARSSRKNKRTSPGGRDADARTHVSALHAKARSKKGKR